MKACLAIPPMPEYPYAFVRNGLQRCGYSVADINHDEIADLLVVWSPWNRSHRQMLQDRYRTKGKPVIVVENGWLSPIHSKPFYQVALDGWNGTGHFVAGDGKRWKGWAMPVDPWAAKPGYALVCGQRGHPFDDRSCLPDWHLSLDLQKYGDPPVLRRPRAATRPLEADLAGASVCHVWTSNAASWAILAGVPVIQHGPNLMVSALASRPGEPLYRGDRLPELERLAWSQWDSSELATGAPFSKLLVPA